MDQAPATEIGEIDSGGDILLGRALREPREPPFASVETDLGQGGGPAEAVHVIDPDAGAHQSRNDL